MSHYSTARWRALVDELTRIRKYRGETQTEIARRAGVAQDRVSAWECGGHTPNMRHLIAWADALGYDVELVAKENA